MGAPVRRQLARDATAELACKLRVRFLVCRELVVPGSFERCSALFRVPAVVNFPGNLERRVTPPDRRARRRDLLGPKRLSVRLRRAGARRGPLADHCFAADEAGFVRHRLCGSDRAIDRFDVVAVDVGDHVPAIGFEALGRVVSEPALDLAVNGDLVVVVERDELAQAERSGERAGLVGDSLHQAAVTDRHVGMVIDDAGGGAVEFGGKDAFCDRHADRIRQSLSQGTRGRLNARGNPEFGVARRLRMQLAEALELLHRQVVARQMQQRIQQHRAVSVREHETIAVGPFRVGRVMPQVPPPERQRDLGHAHGHAGMARVRGLHGVHGQRTNRVGQVLAHVRGKFGRMG